MTAMMGAPKAEVWQRFGDPVYARYPVYEVADVFSSPAEATKIRERAVKAIWYYRLFRLEFDPDDRLKAVYIDITWRVRSEHVNPHL
jgi:hypothetical protein